MVALKINGLNILVVGRRGLVYCFYSLSYFDELEKNELKLTKKEN